MTPKGTDARHILALSALVGLLSLPACGDDGGLPQGAGRGPECIPETGSIAPPPPAEDAGAPAVDAGGGGEDAGAVPPPLDSGASTPPPVDDIPGCASDEICLAVGVESDGAVRGRCYPRCRGDGDCAEEQMCDSATGACVTRTLPRMDAGAPDVGSTDPCADVECLDPDPLCHPATQECVVCTSTDSSRCGAATGPICDVAFGQCSDVTPQVCSPCGSNADCVPGTRCEERTEPFERVCMAECDNTGAGCPQGTQCVISEGLCFPLVSCTSFLAGILGRSCGSDADCLPPNTSTVITPCIADADAGTAVCRQACRSDFPCPTGFACEFGAMGQFCFPTDA